MVHTMILKEEIAQLHIIPADVDRTNYWKEELAYAVRLGNEFKGKTTITFETSEGARTVETTVWSLTDKYIVLKSGTTIPMNSITEVHF
jgi:hypothetical protein